MCIVNVTHIYSNRQKKTFITIMIAMDTIAPM